MFRYLVEERGVAPGKILIHGYSMGGPIAADLARYAAEQGKPVGGLLLDRPMPSMSKAITANELPNPVVWWGRSPRRSTTVSRWRKPRRPAQEHAHHVADRQRGARQ